jgi:hypothetical protein
MEIAQARLTGTVEEWNQVCEGVHTLECFHQVAQLLADDLLQVLRRNKDLKAHLLNDENRLTLTLSLQLEDAAGKSESILRQWPSTS